MPTQKQAKMTRLSRALLYITSATWILCMTDLPKVHARMQRVVWNQHQGRQERWESRTRHPRLVIYRSSQSPTPKQYKFKAPIYGLIVRQDQVFAVGRRCVYPLRAQFRGARCLAKAPEQIQDVSLVDLDGDGQLALVALLRRSSPKAEGRLMAIGLKQGRSAELPIEALPGAWRLDSADVTGNGREELLVGVYCKAHFDPKMAKRIWLYQYHIHIRQIVPFWRGTKLALPILDFMAGPMERGQRAALTVLEATQQRRRLMSYEFRGFNFWGKSQHPLPPHTTTLLSYWKRPRHRALVTFGLGDPVPLWPSARPQAGSKRPTTLPYHPPPHSQPTTQSPRR